MHCRAGQLRATKNAPNSSLSAYETDALWVERGKAEEEVDADNEKGKDAELEVEGGR